MAGGATVESVLARLLHPLSVQRFFDDVWGRRHHHVSRGQPGCFDDLLAASSAADDLLRWVRPDPATLRLVRGDHSNEADRYRSADGTLDTARVRDDFARGYTIVVNKLERYERGIAAFAHALEVELNFPVQVNAYVTPPGATGFVPHYDPHDVLVLQIGGSKRWHLYGEQSVPPHVMQRHEQLVTAALPAPTDLLLRPGDVLYLPRGRPHAAESGAEVSVHLTVGLHAPTVLTLLTHVLHALSVHDDRVHEQLPPRYLDDSAVRTQLTARLAETAPAIAEPAAVADGIAALANILSRRAPCPPVPPAPSALAVDTATAVRKHQPLYARVVALPDGVGLQFAQTLVSRGVDHEAALRFVARRRESFRVGDLPGLAEAQQISLARDLLLTGFLESAFTENM
ncbi:cupin [Mycobacterium sp. 1274756.6]|nr:cupin [Mycobacterium sp. 1274756.6]